MTNTILIIGISGMLFILIAFILSEFYKKFDKNTIQYNLFNILGSLLLLLYALSLRGYPFVILNALWLIVATIKLYEILTGKNHLY